MRGRYARWRRRLSVRHGWGEQCVFLVDESINWREEIQGRVQVRGRKVMYGLAMVDGRDTWSSLEEGLA
jgi:hypothetical protein